ncbi:MAG: glycoside hydrolase family 2 TIM barrel-domain containing protein [Anaerolineaceae bacterium]|jgi:beta-galactosidase/beta-glucuronidase|nr:glycoside hydrolase family 2 TIM barrel-domain containing protein [Anaerolineaceae bacterium]
MKNPKFNKLTTPWQPAQPIPWPEYPRPQMAREKWQNLNGWWDYCIQSQSLPQPTDFDGKILVPFAPESVLSGVERVLQPEEKLWYQRQFEVSHTPEQVVVLHFGAVDFFCQVLVNGIEVGSHWGGFLPFSFDITSALQEGQNSLIVMVQDETEAALHQKGKQRLNPGGIWYTSVSGIWQTVWLEVLPKKHISSLKITPSIDTNTLELKVKVSEETLKSFCQVEATASFEGQEVARARGGLKSTLVFHLPDAKLWHPDHPHLYDLDVRLVENENQVDQVKSYFAMRKFGKSKDENGLWRFTLNNEPIFQYGPLDQGYFPEGLYTAPSEEAMLFDIEYAKKIGCNMIRKHVKVEPLRWYHACDKLGMIVWQDMPNGGRTTKDAIVLFTFTSGIHRYDQHRLKRFGREDPENREEFRAELQDMVETLYNCPCIGVWTPFNESWGQFHAIRIAEWVKTLDPTRLVDHASGWFDQGGGDFQSRHVYVKPLSARIPDDRILAVTEFGGYTMQVPDHVYTDRERFGYGHYQDAESLTAAYLNLLEQQVKPLIPKGLSAAIYTQTSDIETEINGFLSYDRKVEKMDSQILREAHQELIELL